MKFLQAILLIISVVLFLVIINPKRVVLIDLQKERDSFEIVRGHGQELQKTKAELIAKFKSIPEEEAARLLNFLPDTVDNVRLLVDIDAIAKRKRLNISGLRINTNEAQQEGENQGGIGKVSMDFTVVSDYGEMKDLLVELEESLRMVDVRKISVAGGTDSRTVSTTVTIDTYWLR